LLQEGVNVLNAVRFVDDDVLETELLEGGLLDEADLIARDAYFEVLGDELVRNNVCVLLLCAGKDDDVDAWSPLFELARPILKGRFGDYSKMRVGNAEVML
jgi:hypothetical protein